MNASRILQYYSKPISLIITGFVVVLIQIVDLSAGDTWAINVNGRVSQSQIILYASVMMASIVIQVLLLATTTRLIFSIKKPASRIALIVAYIYVMSQLAIIVLLGSLLVEQLVTNRYHILLSKLITGTEALTILFTDVLLK